MNQSGFEIDFCRQCRNSLFNLKTFENEIKSIASESSHSAKRSHEKIKAGFSACPNACASPQIKDFGMIAFIIPELIPESCISCGKCYEVCRENAIDFKTHPKFNENCIGCGDCMRVCEQDAIKGEVRFRLLAGGRLGRHPRFAQVFMVTDNPSYIKEAFEKVVEVSERHGKRFSHVEGCVDLLLSMLKE